MTPGDTATGAPDHESGSMPAGVSALAFLQGGGEMGALVRQKDWTQTPLGAAEGWPQSLRSAVSICLGSAFPIAIYWGPELALLYNDAWSPIPGAKHPWALGRPAREVWPEILDTIGPLFHHVMTTGEATRSKDQLLAMRRHGYTEECYFDYTFSPIRGESGQVEGIFNAVLETTERVISERRLRIVRELAEQAAEARTSESASQISERTLARATADIPFALLYLLSADGTEAVLSNSTGLEPHMPASPRNIGLREPAVEPEVWPVAQVLRTGTALSVENLHARLPSLPGGPWPESPDTALVLPVSRAGRDRPFGVLVAGISPRRVLDGDYRSFLEIVTGHIGQAFANAEGYEEERKRAEALAEIDRAKTAFFSNVSHEFRTPLTLMLGPLEELLATNRSLPPDVAELVSVTHRNGLRLQKLVNTLLDFSRIEAGRVRASYEPTDLAAFTAALASTFRSAVEKARLRLIVECPPLNDPVYVDREMWEKVVLNLLSNAFKYTLEGKITVRLAREGEYARLSVEDTGTGIPESALPRLFERFHRVEGARGRTQEGTGIGLALVAELVKFHGGTVDVRSTLGQGSVFTVSLPFGTAHLPAKPSVGTLHTAMMHADSYVEEAAQWVPRVQNDQASGDRSPQKDDAPTQSTPHSHPASRARVLVADDNADMRDYLARLLAGRYEVEVVSNGEEALASVRNHRPDLVVSDVMMPRLDGFELLQALRQDPETSVLPVILVSARAGEEARIEGLDAGASDYLVKPFTARELLARVGAHLEMASVKNQSEARLRESQERLQAIYDGTFEYIGLLAPDGTLLEANRASLEFAGNRREEVVGKSFWDTPWFAGTPGAPEMIRDAVARAASGESVRFEATVLRPSGEPWTFDISFHPIRNANGQVVLIVPEGRNITDRKLAEEALREQYAIREADRRKWRELFFQVPAGVAILRGPDHRFEHFNQEYLRLVGRSAEQLSGRPVREALPEVVPQGYIELLDGVYRTGIPHVTKEAPIQLDVHADGVLEDAYLNLVCYPIRDDAGRIDGIFAHVVDVTDLVQARKRIEEANQRFSLALAATRGLVYDWELQTGRMKREGGLEALTGWQEHEVPATSEWWNAQVHPEDAARLRFEDALDPVQKKRIHTYRVRHRNGDWKWVEDHALVHRNQDGEIVRVIGITIDITARKEAEAELLRSRQRFQIAARALSDVIWTNNADGEMEGEQPAWGNFTGQSYEEYQGYGWSKAIHPDDAQPTVDAWKLAVAEQRKFSYEHRVRRHDGAWRVFSIRALPILDERGEIREWVGVHTDITDRRQAEEALRQSEERFRQLAESMPQIVFTATADGVCDYVNSRWRELTGFDLSGIESGAFRARMLPEDLDLMDRVSTEATRNGEPYTFECRFRRASDDTLRWYLVRGVPVRDANGEVTKWLGTSTDIDEQKQAAEALRLSEWRLRFTLEAANFGSWELDLATHHVNRSPRHDAVFGYEKPLPDWTYSRFLEHVIEEDQERVDRSFQVCLNDGGECNFECRIRRGSDGAIRWIWAYGKTIADTQKTPSLMVGLVSDITERKEAEAALAEANQELKRANADLEQFGYSASHDLQEPLRSVIIYSELLSRRYGEKLDGQALELLGFVKSGASRMEMLVRDLLTFTQVKRVEAPEEADAGEAVKDALANIANAIAESGAQITVGELPAVKVHKVHLQQLFQNLIGNALKYRSQEPPRIHVAAEKLNQQWRFSVSDNGIGIGAQYKEHIFGLFKRLHTGDEYSGTGIGLAICQRIVVGYGGRIWVESEPGKGSTFYFTVPV